MNAASYSMQSRFASNDRHTPRVSAFRVRGQSVTEFVVLSLVLIPLFVLIPYIARYQDISQATLLASRYAAFDAINYDHDDTAHWKSQADLADEVRRRFYSNPTAPIKTDDTAGEFRAHRNPFWHDPNGDPLIRNFADVSVRRTDWNNRHEDPHLDLLTPAHDGTPFILVNGNGNGSFNLKARGLYQATASVDLANLPDGLKFYEPFDKLNLTMTRSTVLLVDPWVAKSADDVVKRIKDSPEVYPAASNAPPFALTKTLIPMVIDVETALIPPPEIGELEKWKDVVPEDRLR